MKVGDRVIICEPLTVESVDGENVDARESCNGGSALTYWIGDLTTVTGGPLELWAQYDLMGTMVGAWPFEPDVPLDVYTVKRLIAYVVDLPASDGGTGG